MKKTAIITGGAGGIGYAIVKQLLADNRKVVAMDLPAFENVKNLFEDLQGDFQYIQGDLTKAEDRNRLIHETVERFHTIDILVNVAGVAPSQRMDLLEMTEESFDRVIGINVKGTLTLTQQIAKQMIAQKSENLQKGIIINISSVSAYTSSVNRGEYCISKAGVSMLTKLFADRLAEENIFVYEIRPGIIATGMTQTVKEKYDKLIFSDGILPVKRWGNPEDVANGVSVLCSGMLAYSTGEVLNVDGGFHLRRL